MNQSIKAKKVNVKKSTDEIINRGDCCVIENLQYNTDTDKPHPAIILRCPICRSDMASTRIHKIEMRTPLLYKIFGIDKKKISVSPMLQCPYNPSHKFYIKMNKIKIIT